MRALLSASISFPPSPAIDGASICCAPTTGCPTGAPSCGKRAFTAERTLTPARMSAVLDSGPGIRERPRTRAAGTAGVIFRRIGDRQTRQKRAHRYSTGPGYVSTCRRKHLDQLPRSKQLLCFMMSIAPTASQGSIQLILLSPLNRGGSSALKRRPPCAPVVD
jgi:hypothetical protein